ADVNVLINGVRWVMKGGAVVVDRTGPGGSGRSGGVGASALDERAVRDVVERFLLHLGDHQVDAVAADLAPKALVIVTRTRAASGAGAPEWTNSYQTGDE